MVRVSLKDFKRAYGAEKTSTLIDNGVTELFLSKEFKYGHKEWILYGKTFTKKKKKIIKKINSHKVLSQLLGDEDFEKEYHELLNTN